MGAFKLHLEIALGMSQGPAPVLIALALGSVLGGGAPGAAAPAAPPALTAAVSVPPHAWLVGRVGGERVEVITLLAPGASPETYQPDDARVSRVMRADLLFRAGVPMEAGAWFRALARSGGVEVVDLRQGVPLRRMEEHAGAVGDHGGEEGHAPSHAHAHGGEDPHTWTSPRVLAIQARTVAAALARRDPVGRGEYEANLSRLAAELAALDRALAEVLRPLARTSFFVFHPAWGYFADDYGLVQVAIESEGKEPGDRELTELQQRARELGARVIFVQPQVPGRSAEAVARAVGARLERLDPLAFDVPANLLATAERLLAAAGLATERSGGEAR